MSERAGFFDTAGMAHAIRGHKVGWIDRQGQVVIELPGDGDPPHEVQGQSFYDRAGMHQSSLMRVWGKLPSWVPRPPFPVQHFEIACYDSSGRMIWSSEDRFRRRFIAGACAVILVLYGLYAGIRRRRATGAGALVSQPLRTPEGSQPIAG